MRMGLFTRGRAKGEGPAGKEPSSMGGEGGHMTGTSCLDGDMAMGWSSVT